MAARHLFQGDLIFGHAELGQVDPVGRHERVGVKAAGRPEAVVVDFAAIVRRDDLVDLDARKAPAQVRLELPGIVRDLQDRN